MVGMQFGRSSEKLAGEIAQLELALEELESSQAADGELPASETAAPAAGTRIRPARRALPDHLPRCHRARDQGDQEAAARAWRNNKPQARSPRQASERTGVTRRVIFTPKAQAREGSDGGHA
jgi:hypothetical protein